MTIESDSVRFSRALRSAVLWPIGVIFLTTCLLVLLISELLQVVKWSDHSYEVLEQTSVCKIQLVSVQNEVRGYVVAGQPPSVQAFADERKEADASFAKLKTLVSDNPPQVTRVDDLIHAKDAWFDHVSQSVSELSSSITLTEDWKAEGRRLMAEVTAKFAAFTSVEEELRLERLKRVSRMKRILAYAGGTLMLALALTVGLSARRHLINLAADYRSALRAIEQRQTELQDQKEWFRVTLTSIGDGVIVTNEKGRVVFMNPEAESLTEWKSADAQFKPLIEVFKIINETTRVTVDDPVEKVFREKKVVGLANHTVLISREGKEWPIEDSAAPIFNAHGELLGAVLVFHNATDMRLAQNKLKNYSLDLEQKVTERTHTLQQTVAELESFSYTISHDLRSPLRAMQGFAQALLEDYAEQVDAQGKNYLERIKNAAERLDRLIQDLLAYTRISREDAPLVPLDLDKFVHDIIEHYPNLRAPDVKIEVVGVLPKIMGREAALTQVISNLLGNAVKFVVPGTTPHIKIWSEDAGSKIRLWIEDNGIGIAQRNFERIFQMFVQINQPTLYGGTGIGLTIVKKAVQQMHGTIGLQSQEGGGSKFWVELNKA